MTQHGDVRELCRTHGQLLHLAAPNQMLVRVEGEGKLGDLAHQLRAQGFHLVTLVATDERELIDRCFKLTYLFSPPNDDLFLFVEYPLLPSSPADRLTYSSLYPWFRAADPFEREMADMMGLLPEDNTDAHPGEHRLRVRYGDWLHSECYPPSLTPLRHDRSTNDILRDILAYVRQPALDQELVVGDGEWTTPVGPVHAVIIPPARFLFRLAGEAVEEAAIRLGYTHKGIERVFQSECSLETGWQLAEYVAGDSAFAHSLAYCLAAEGLANIAAPRSASYLRVLFLELERIANHIGDCASIFHDAASGLAAAELAALREDVLQLHDRMVGHRLLRGLNRPGGIVLQSTFDCEDCRRTVAKVAQTFADVTASMHQTTAWRQRLQWQGILTQQQASDLGITGLVARASGLMRDARLQHPTCAYQDDVIQDLLRRKPQNPISGREAAAGDTLARFLIRVQEVASSAQIIDYLLDQDEVRVPHRQHLAPVSFPPSHNYEFGMGCIEGWRGDVVYWLMQDRFGRIFRCKVRDPSYLNWPGLKAAIEPHELDDKYIAKHHPPEKRALTLLSNFPIINKSFNLSYSGNDL